MTKRTAARLSHAPRLAFNPAPIFLDPQLRQHYQVGQENQLGALGLMVNIIVLWQTVYMQAALDHLAANGHHPDPADVARLSPLGTTRPHDSWSRS